MLVDESRLLMTRTYQRLVKGTNINEVTLLATDYLNHYNELVMLIDLVPDMPEMLDEAKEWQPKSYSDHFKDSTFSDKDLAILAYENAADEHRLPFDAVIREVDDRISVEVTHIDKIINTGAEGQLRETVRMVSRDLQELLDRASAIINGDYGAPKDAEPITLDQDEIDAFFD